MVLVGLLSSLGGLLKPTGKTDIDSPICKLHHNFTTTILLCFCLLVTATNLFGDPVKCTSVGGGGLRYDVVNTYCWIHPTFTLRRHFESTDVAHPGVYPNPRNDEKIYHAYFEWVPFVLFLQALMFYAPYWLWKTWEGGKVESASMDLSTPVMNREDRWEKIHMLADYLHASLHHHNGYAIKYLFSEMLNFAITVTNICLIDKFLDGKFISYGTEVFSFFQTEDEERVDPRIALFPRMTKCTFVKLAPSGTIERWDNLCMMAHNIINEKVHLFLWVWLWILLVADFLAIVWRCLIFFVPSVRIHLLKTYTQGLNINDKKILSENLEVGDYFLLYLLHKNVSHLSFSDLVKEVASRIAGKASNSLEMEGPRRATVVTWARI